MKLRSIFIFIILVFLVSTYLKASSPDTVYLYKANDPKFRYIGRIDFTNPELPKFWSPGVYIQASFSGSSCEIILNDEVLWGKSHNYISIVIDSGTPQRIKLKEKVNALKVAQNLNPGPHSLLICKGTEAGIGYLEFVGIRVQDLLDPPNLSDRKIEFIGNSITCGTGSDISEFPCGTGEWYDQHNAYMSYGPTTARILNARWVQTSVSGIGLTHSCCNMDRIITDVIDKLNLNDKHSALWNFGNYQSDVISIMLGQNDGVQDSAFFCKAYIDFIKQLRGYYPNATIICVTSPMADESLLVFMKKMLTAVVAKVNETRDSNVYSYFFSQRFHNGCGDHPSLEQHAMIAQELSGFIKKIKNW